MSRVSGQLSAVSGQPRRSPGSWVLLVASFSLASCAGPQLRGERVVAPAFPAKSAITEKTAPADLFRVPPTVKAEAAGAPAGPLLVTASEAVLLCLQNNRAFAVERYKPAVTQTFEDDERAAFDPVLSGSASRKWSRVPLTSSVAALTSVPSSIGASSTDLEASADEFLPTGTSLNLGFSGRPAESSGQDSARLGLTVTQSLLRGFGTEANLANLRQARLDTLVSAYELRGFAQDLVAQAEEAYWDFALAKQQIAIVTESLALAQGQLEETRARIGVGQLAEIEQAAAEAEVARRREAEIDARSRLATTRLTLLRLLNPPGGALWRMEVDVLDSPKVPEKGLDDVEDHVNLALTLRPELNQARLQVRRGDLEVVKTRNGLLPKLDAFVTLGKTGYASSFGGALADVDGVGYDAQVGLRGEFPWGNRAPLAAERRAVLGRSEAREAVENLIQLAQVDVRSAHVEANRLKEQVAATAATRRFQEETLRAETEKFRVGKSTALLVAQAQRDLLQSQIDEVAAVVNHLKALVELYRQDGSLLERRGIAAPGQEPVELPSQ